MFCTTCGAQIADDSTVCLKCGVPIAKSRVDQDSALRMLVPIGRSGWAIAAGYLGLLSLIPFFGIFALITGIVALRDIKAHPDKHGKGRAWLGIVMGAGATLICILMLIAMVMGS